MKKSFISIVIIGLFVYSFIRLFLPVQADQSISVTGTVPPSASDFQLAVSQNTTSVSQGSIITYTITYGSHLYYPGGLKIQAQWYLGTLNSNSSPSIDGMAYINGNASNAYGNTPPVVDLTNNTITWNIPSFPAQTINKTVTFQLATSASYTGGQQVTYPVKVRLIAPSYTTYDQTANTLYQYNNSLASTASPQSSANTSSATGINTIPTSQPETAPTTNTTNEKTSSVPSSTSQPTTSAPVFQPTVSNVNILNLSQNNAQFAITLTTAAKTKVIYGISPNALTTQLPLTANGNSGIISLDNLSPETNYYMQVVTTSPNGTITKSDVFSVETAQASSIPEVAKTSLVVTSDTDVLYSSNLTTQTGSNPTDAIKKTPQIPLAQGSNYNLSFKLTKTNSIKSVSMILQNLSVLGASTVPRPNLPLAYVFPVSQDVKGIYNVQLRNPTIAGLYDAYIRITDYDGNITTQKVAQFRVLRPFRIYNATTKQPIEDARIVLFRYNPDTKKFELLPTINGFKNPLYTNKNGEASEPLPRGTYKINVGRIGFKGKDNLVFSIGKTSKDDFPTIYLSPTPVTPLSLFIYYRNAFFDYIGVTQSYIQAIQASNRFFDLIGLSVIFCFLCITLLLFKFKTHIAFSHIPYYLHHHLLLFGKKESPYIHGTIIDKKNKQPLDHALVFILDEATHRVIGQTTTNKVGSFLLSVQQGSTYLLFVMKEGYEPSGQVGYNPQIVIPLQKGETIKKKVVEIVGETVENSFALCFEFMLVFTLILEIILFPAFGLYRTLPGLLISLLNILLWAFYTREKGKQLSISLVQNSL